MVGNLNLFFCCLNLGPSERFLVVRNHRTPSAAVRASCPRWSTAPAAATSEIWPWAAVRGRAPATKTSWPCSRRKAASLPAEEPESLPWSFSKAQTLWLDGSRSSQPPRRRLAREGTQHPETTNPTISEWKYCLRVSTRSVCCWQSYQPILRRATHCRRDHLTLHVQPDCSNHWLTICIVQSNWSTLLDGTVPPMVETLLFSVKPVPLRKKEIHREQSLFNCQWKVEVLGLC